MTRTLISTRLYSRAKWSPAWQAKGHGLAKMGLTVGKYQTSARLRSDIFS